MSCVMSGVISSVLSAIILDSLKVESLVLSSGSEQSSSLNIFLTIYTGVFTCLLLRLLDLTVSVCRSSGCGGGGCDECGGGDDECGGGESGGGGGESESDGDSGIGDRVRERDEGDLGCAGGVITSCFISPCGLGGGGGVFKGVGGGVSVECSVECACLAWLEGFLALDLDLDLFGGCQPITGLALFSGLMGFNLSIFIK